MDERWVVEVATLEGGWRKSSLYSGVYTTEEATAIAVEINAMGAEDDFRVRRFVPAEKGEGE